MNFFVQWILFYTSIIFTMCVDNICWIPTSPEWSEIKHNFLVITLFGNEWAIPKNKNGWNYTWNKRILEVIKHPRDISPAIITSLILTLIW